jgi:hypothetical protein
MDAHPDLIAMRPQAEECGFKLSTPDRRSVRAAVANSVLEGYQPTPDGIALLTEFTAYEITVEQYKARALDQLGLHHHSAESA